MMILFENALVGAAQTALEITLASMVSPSDKVEEEKVDPIWTKVPLTRHLIVGAVPLLTGNAEKVTGVPAHTGPEGIALMVMDGIALGVMDTAIVFELATGGCGHKADDVIWTFTRSPLLRAEVVNVG
jgi:hypothetical protein